MIPSIQTDLDFLKTAHQKYQGYLAYHQYLEHQAFRHAKVTENTRNNKHVNKNQPKKHKHVKNNNQKMKSKQQGSSGGTDFGNQFNDRVR